MLLWGVCFCSVLSLLPRPGSLLKVSLRTFSQESERREARTMASRAFKQLHEIFHIADRPQKLLSRKKAPQFMLDLFNSVADSNGITRDPRMLEGNVVRSFEERVYSDRTFHFFNLSSFSKNERVIKAELRVLRNKKTRSSWESYSAHIYKVDVYEVQDDRLKPYTGALISSRFSPLYKEWEVFNVTKTVSKWIKNNGTNKGFLVTATLPSGKLLETEMSGLDRNEDKRSYLVIFSDDGRRGSNVNQFLSYDIPFQNADKRKPHAPNTAEGEAGEMPSRNKSRTTRAAPHYPKGISMTCQRRPLYVDFEKIGWSGWIISPRGYDAYYCKGSCPFPLGEGLGATNHATVQSIVHALKASADVGTPCCVPDQLRSISLLYFDDDENVVLKQYDDMVVVSCGCH